MISYKIVSNGFKKNTTLSRRQLKALSVDSDEYKEKCLAKLVRNLHFKSGDRVFMNVNEEAVVAGFFFKPEECLWDNGKCHFILIERLSDKKEFYAHPGDIKKVKNA